MSPRPKAYAFPSTHLFTVEDWHKMGEIGLFSPETRVELIEGEIIEMGQIGSLHAGHVNRLNYLLNKQIKDSEIVSVQNPVILENYSEPQPDLMVLRHKAHFYSEKHPTPEDVLLLIEVSDSTLTYDRNIKRILYARHGIIEYWVVNLKDNCIEVYLNPQAQDYTLIHIIRCGEVIIPSQLPHISIAVSDILD
ncbi:Uma2 family endonuclease [Candidatus Parabeggiatoa sp. HSG14]|uniref:Uma2 family endonuclease n=1 Tax=Candidatus Parabeggiatoa sp. HSG14 TaxID=3055593 RepID=UPI0025A869F7|nr:Uma2 family endonuclease [Thiotrichales bacterium HSG14]